ncbi:NAD-dependent epimerase/dehydratase family protein [Auritidibacter ignavus]|uniref:NAD-dependent epimerase/dehydratase family protein n=1 Tax=Auritidibacter ignavus TaxID=678932 RepID=A0AAJ6ANT6_9MICC|nr:NAD-dependent epimerase/dehydratase family protein [Auritidibacter ignavus]WGH94193.1 NAD-dependent epimerase/dehydratase family protein [Auritidibacter ignavus]
MNQPLHVTVTGAGGFLGSHVVSQLEAAGEKVTALADANDCDITDAQDVEQTIGPCDVIVHCAAMVTIEDQVKPQVRAVNVEGTANILEAARRHQARLVYVSSVHALTEAPTGVVMEEPESFDPDTVFGGVCQNQG